MLFQTIENSLFLVMLKMVFEIVWRQSKLFKINELVLFQMVAIDAFCRTREAGEGSRELSGRGIIDKAKNIRQRDFQNDATKLYTLCLVL